MRDSSIPWLPIDSRLFLPLFRFGHLKGLAKLFVFVEMGLSLLVVFGTLVLVFLHYFTRIF